QEGAADLLGEEGVALVFGNFFGARRRLEKLLGECLGEDVLRARRMPLLRILEKSVAVVAPWMPVRVLTGAHTPSPCSARAVWAQPRRARRRDPDPRGSTSALGGLALHARRELACR